MPWSLEFLPSSRVLIHHGARWSVRDWPTLEVREEGEGALKVEPTSGRRATQLPGEGWRVDGHGDLGVDEQMSRFAWLATDAVAVVVGSPGQDLPVTRLPVPERGSTAFVFGTPTPNTQRLVRHDLASAEQAVLAAASDRETIQGVAPGPVGAVDYVLAYAPIPGFEPGRHRLRRASAGGADSDVYPHLIGATDLPLRSMDVELVRYSAVASFFPAWWQLCRDDGHPITPTSGRQDTALAQISPRGGRVAVPIERGLSSTIVVASVDGAARMETTELRGSALAIAHDPNGGLLALVRGIDGSIAVVDTARADEPLLALRGTTLPRVELQPWQYDSGGGRLEGILARPRNSSGPLPLIVDLHGGPSPGLTAGMTEVGRWCRHGYLAFEPEFRTSGCLGFESMIAGERYLPDASGMTDVDDVIAGIDSLRRAGLVRDDEVYLFGHSYGGALVSRLARQGVARAAVCWEGATDPQHDYLIRGGNPMDDELLGGPPWRVPDAYDRGSAIVHADEITTPLLLVAGDEDPSTTVALYTALRGRGRDVELVIYADEGHYMARAENNKDLEERSLRWFSSHAPRE